jgi:phosphomethylpyrimidine synthase
VLGPNQQGALNDTQKEILMQRGVLSPDEIHRLASKTKGSMTEDDGKAACHSDLADESSAQNLQADRLDPVTLKPLDGADAPSSAEGSA